jgi:hypothetical protein
MFQMDWNNVKLVFGYSFWSRARQLHEHTNLMSRLPNLDNSRKYLFQILSIMQCPVITWLLRSNTGNDPLSRPTRLPERELRWHTRSGLSAYLFSGVNCFIFLDNLEQTKADSPEWNFYDDRKGWEWIL